MPFDNTNTPAEKIDIRKPSLANLATLLRHRELWPDGFHWDYQFSSNCAIGLAREKWKWSPEIPRSYPKDRVFFGLGGRAQPEYVAAAINNYLAVYGEVKLSRWQRFKAYWD